ncbi:MAG TPA: NYN domain-containing protein [Candidatus Kapabacteria bacterium]|nr:NYN domain-containing protein [Candidatus Kapabacteria bacterium]
MRKTYMIDGFNLLNASPELARTVTAFGMDRARTDMLRAIADFSRRGGCDCTVVFDGVAAGMQPAGVRVVSSRGRSADDLIRDEARRSGRRLVVVTDDLEIIATARTCMATVVATRAFLEQLSFASTMVDREALRPHRIEELRERSEKPNRVDDDDIDEWKKLFGV